MEDLSTIENNLPSFMTHDELQEEIYRLLYTTNAHAKAYFLKTRKTIPLALVLKDTRISTVLKQQEPGPQVDYENLQANLAELRPFFIPSAKGRKLLTFFTTLLETRSAWLLAAAKYFSFGAYCKRLQEYFISPPAQIENDINALAEWESERTRFHAKNQGEVIEARFFDLQKQTEGAGVKLCDLKLSEHMWEMSHVLWCGVQQYDAWLWKRQAARTVNHSTTSAAAAATAAEILLAKRKMEAKRRRDIKGTNRVNVRRQLGGDGRGVDVDPTLQQSVGGWMRDWAHDQGVGYHSPKKSVDLTAPVAL